MIASESTSEVPTLTVAASWYFSTTSRRNAGHRLASQTKTRVPRYKASPEIRPHRSAIAGSTSAPDHTTGATRTAATPIAPSTQGIKRQTSFPRVETAHQPTTSAIMPPIITAVRIGSAR